MKLYNPVFSPLYLFCMFCSYNSLPFFCLYVLFSLLFNRKQQPKSMEGEPSCLFTANPRISKKQKS